MNRASKKTLGMPVYSVREGQNLGFVKTLVIDPGDKAILALVIERRRMTREERIIPFIHIQSIGDDVIVVDKASSAERKANLPQIISHMRNPLHVLGARVFTIGGKILGKVEEFYFDIQSGKIMLLEIGGTTGAIFKEKVTIEGKYIVTMANGTIMMDDKALENMEIIENPIINSMGSAKGKAQNIINETINTSKKISKNITNSWDKLNNNASEDGYVSFENDGEVKEAEIQEANESDKPNETASEKTIDTAAPIEDAKTNEPVISEQPEEKIEEEPEVIIEDVPDTNEENMAAIIDDKDIDTIITEENIDIAPVIDNTENQENTEIDKQDEEKI